jgi:hypothetical protein
MAKETLEVRLRELRTDLNRIKETNPINWNAVIGIYKLIKENERLLWEFQCITQSKDPRSIYNPQFQDIDYATMYELEKEEEINREARAEVDTWTDEQKRAFLEAFAREMKEENIIDIDRKSPLSEIIKIEERCNICII